MGTITYHENLQRGSLDFPASFYHIDKKHPKYQMMAHWHTDYEIIRVISGRLEVNLNGKEIVLNEKESIFIPGNIMHSAEPYDCVYECIVFSKSIFGAASKCKSDATNFGISTYYNSTTVDLLFEAFRNKGEGYEFRVVSFIYMLSSDVFTKSKLINIADNKSMQRIKPAILIIEEKYDSKISLQELAYSCDISPNYFSRIFKEITGQTPFEYILAYRIEVACELLLSGTDNITDICYKTGFNDLSYFINVFKKHIGISPKKYASTHR